MVRLLIRDCLLTYKKLLIYGITCFVCMILIIMIGNLYGILASGATAVFFCYFCIMVLFETGGKNNGDIMLLALPYKRDMVLYGKYLSVFLGTLFYFSAGILFTLVAGIGGGHQMNGKGVGVVVLLCLLLASLLIPIFIRYEYIKAMNAALIGLFSVVVLFTFAIRSVPVVIYLKQMISVYGYIHDMVFILAGLGILAVSVLLSRRMFRVKEL